MSELIIIGYDEETVAGRAYERVLELQRDFILDLSGVALIRVDVDGKKHVDTPSRIVGGSVASGALWGMLFGLLFLSPAIGMLLGGAWGALIGRLGQSGIDRSFKERVDGMLEPGHAAVVILARKVTDDKFAAGMSEFGGTVLQTSLSEEDELALVDELA